jgi:predicted DNA-binding protein (MmcQ/YjbR family)
MTIDAVREICLALPAVTEDIKWGHDLCFSVGGKMFVGVDLTPPHSIAFKCTPESFGELIERPGMRPAPYMARNRWAQEERLGEVLDRRELGALLKTSYELVVAKLPKSRRPGTSEVQSHTPIKASPSRKRRPMPGRNAGITRRPVRPRR